MGAGSSPAFNTLAISLASSMLSNPLICVLPEDILSLMNGAIKTKSSNIIATCLLMLAPVNLLHFFLPSLFISKLTTHCPALLLPISATTALGVCIIPPEIAGFEETKYNF